MRVWTNNPYTIHFLYSDEISVMVMHDGRAIPWPVDEN
jgi:hypothetical protein